MKIKIIITLIMGCLYTRFFFVLVTTGIENILGNNDKGLFQCAMSFFFIVAIAECVKEILKDDEG